MTKKPKINDGQFPSPFPRLEELRSAMEQILTQNRETIYRVAAEWNRFEMFTFVGGGTAWVVACESALKMRENNYTFAEGYEVEEFAHGRTCSFAPDRPFVAFAFRGPSFASGSSLRGRAKNLLLPAGRELGLPERISNAIVQH